MVACTPSLLGDQFGMAHQGGTIFRPARMAAVCFDALQQAQHDRHVAGAELPDLIESDIGQIGKGIKRVRVEWH